MALAAEDIASGSLLGPGVVRAARLDRRCRPDRIGSLVRTKKLELDELALFDRDPLYAVRTKPEQRTGVKPKEFTALEFLSASPHPWDPGTVLCATINIDGFAEDNLKSLLFQVQGNRTVGFRLDSGSIIGSGFADGPVTVSNPGDFCFAFPASVFGSLDQEHDGMLTLKVTATSEWGDQAVKTQKVEKLVRYTGTNRYLDRDSVYGGDSWLKPHVVKWLETITAIGNRTSPSVKFKWGDMSNMNGGRSFPHAAHRDGVDVEGTFPDYHKRFKPTEYAAKVLVALLRSSQGPHIRSIQVSFKRGDAFHKFLLRAARLPDGRDPKAVILRSRSLGDLSADYNAKFKIWFKDL